MPLEVLRDSESYKISPWLKFEELAILVPALSKIDKRGPLKNYLKKNQARYSIIQRITNMVLGSTFQILSRLVFQLCKFTILILDKPYIKRFLILNITTFKSDYTLNPKPLQGPKQYQAQHSPNILPSPPNPYTRSIPHHPVNSQTKTIKKLPNTSRPLFFFTKPRN